LDASAELLENLARHLDLVALPFDPELAVPREDLDPERVANLSKELVSTSEDGKLFVVAVETDRNFRHPSSFVGQGRADRTVPDSSLIETA
jgi:hypothetical protein